ncbi:MAG: leucine-rich repeat protein [Bacteroidales bacterium]|nr:leucine-rich repeat protein [Bacteroidales bacterium]
MKKLILPLLVAIFMAVPTFAYDFPAVSPSGHTLYYEYVSKSDKTVRVTYELNGSETYTTKPTNEVTIPSTVINEEITYSVIEIGVRAFFNCNKITSIVIQEGVKRIGTSAFQSCERLQSVVLPQSLETIGESAFNSCGKLSSINLPNSITTIESAAFHYCKNLSTITLPNSLTKIGNSAFLGTYAMSSVSIPASVKNIGAYAFDNPYLKNIYINSTTPPSIDDNFVQINTQIFVPCNTLENYTSNEDWEPYKDYIKSASHRVSVLSSNTNYGTVSVQEGNESMCDDEFTLTLTATLYSNAYRFGGWSDGSKENPRTVTITKDTSFTALFGEKPRITNIQKNNPICTSATGSVSFDVEGGVAPYTVTWYGEDNTDNPRTGMTEGDYAFFVTDALGFTSDLQYEYLYSENNNMPVIETNTVLPICETATGEITPTITGGQEPYSYQWSEFSTKETTILAFEDEELPILVQTRIYDENYTSTLSYQISDGGALGTEYAVHMDDYMFDDIFILQTDINNTFNITGELGISFYHKGDAMKFGLAIDKYLFHMKDIPAHPLWTKVEFNLDKINPTQEELLAYLQNECGSDYNLFAEKAMKLGYVWQFNQQEVWIDEISFIQNDESSVVSTDESLTNIASGLYELKITDTYGCATTSKMYVGKNVSNSPEITFETKNPICETENGEISVSVTGGTEPYTYQWNDGETDASRTNLAENGYMLTVTDANGCTQSKSAVLEKDYSNIPQIEMITKNPICETENGEITTTVTNGVEPYSFAWNFISPVLIADFEETSNNIDMLLFAVFNDSGFGGTTKTDESGITTGGALGTAHSMRVKATSISKNVVTDYALLSGTLDFGYGGVAHLIYGISFYHKGAQIDFRALGDDDYTDIIPAHDDWTLVTVFLGENFTPTEFHWAYRGEENYQKEIEFQIDEINFLMVHSSDLTTKDQSNLSEGVYKLIVTDTYGCGNFEYAELKKDESNMPVISKNVKQAICGHEVGEISISYEKGNEPVTFTWDDDAEITELNRTELKPGKYKVTLTDNYGCEVSDSTEIVAESFQYQPEIALVTVSQESPANLVVWQKEETEAIDFYSIYRETTNDGVYEKIDEVPYNQTSIYVDDNTDSQTKAYRYKISATDNCGNESPQSPNHKTIHVTINQGLNGVNNLIWDHYEGFEFSTYSIFRITTDGVTEIDRVPSSNWTFTEKNAPKNTLSYYVAVELPKEIDVNEPFQKAESGPFALAVSNIAEVENQGTPVALVDENSVNVYSTHNAIVVENAGENQIIVCNALGQTIARAKGENDIQKTFAVEAGIYIVIVGNKVVKVVVE